MSSKNLILTIAIGKDYQMLAGLTHPTIRAYAEKIGADFKVITEQEISKTTPHWEKFQIHELLDHYDRILYVDTDLIIRNDCPDLFAMVPETHLGMFEEGKYTERPYCLIRFMADVYGMIIPRWDGNYYNAGVMVISRIHQLLFKKPTKEVNNFYEQSYLNAVIARDQVKMFDIGYKFNHMSCMKEWESHVGKPDDRMDSFILHYAGWGWLPDGIVGIGIRVDDLLKEIRADLDEFDKIKEDNK